MRILIQPDYDRLSQWAAHYVAWRIAEFDPSPDRPFVLGLPTGSTPKGMYRRLVELHREDRLSFRNVVTFNMDEYVGLAEDHPESYHAFMWEHLFRHVDIPEENIHIPDGNAADLRAECEAYEAAIAAAGGVHLFIGGIGHDGHLAFNEPGSSLSSRTRVKTLTEQTRRANARFFDDDVGAVPRQALTVGIGTIMDAEEVMILISGEGKAQALQKVVEEGVNHMWTASALQMHQRGMIVCDEAATAELNEETVKYFKDIERANSSPLPISQRKLQAK